MFLFDILFGRRRRQEPAAAPAAAAERTQSAPGTRIKHDPELIASLQADHQLLLEVFGAIGEAAAAGDLADAEKRLGHFRTLITDHLLKENVRLYVYLEHLLTDDAARHAQMQAFRHEMDAIGKAVVAFLGKYKAIASEPQLAEDFNRDLAAVGSVLAARIGREEATLYPMYAAPA
jgi:regulator of sigma D